MKPLREPMAVRELHRIREAMLADAARTGRSRFLARLNRLGEEFARKHHLRWVKAAGAGRRRAAMSAPPSETP